MGSLGSLDLRYDVPRPARGSKPRPAETVESGPRPNWIGTCSRPGKTLERFADGEIQKRVIQQSALVCRLTTEGLTRKSGCTFACKHDAVCMKLHEPACKHRPVYSWQWHGNVRSTLAAWLSVLYDWCRSNRNAVDITLL